MSRIQQILSKAARDGTTRPIASRLERPRSAVVTPIGPRAERHAWPEAPSEPRLAAHTPHVTVPDDDAPVVSGRPVFGAKLHRDLVAALATFSPAAEQYRTLRTRIAQLDAVAARRVILVTSPGAGDGRTVTVANLALTMAQEFQRRVLLIDADLRHARLHACLGIAREPGLADVLTGTASLDESLVSLPEYRLCILPAGKAHGQPTELLNSDPMHRLIGELSRRFDRVLLDATAAHFADASVLEAVADGVLLVVRAGRTRRPAISRALGLIPASKLLGLVLNESQMSAR